MAIEIERKFLLKNNSWREQIYASKTIRQGYLAPVGTSSIRVRIQGDKANINIKSARLGIKRTEYEYDIPLEDAIDMLDNLCQQPQINKTRHLLKVGRHTWEIDEFYDDNDGLIVAEVELEAEDEAFEKPDWLGQEVSDDRRYYNVSLVKNPYKSWSS